MSAWSYSNIMQQNCNMAQGDMLLYLLHMGDARWIKNSKLVSYLFHVSEVRKAEIFKVQGTNQGLAGC